MKKLNPFLVLILLYFLFNSCVKEHHFGKSPLKKIFYFTLKGQVGVTNIRTDSLIIEIMTPNSSDLSGLLVDSVQLSSYAAISHPKGTEFDGSNPVSVYVTAEDESKAHYILKVKKEALEPQLDNADFKDWYLVSGDDYQEPGISESSTIWATGNAGVVTLGQANAVPVTIEGQTAVELKTVNLPLGQFIGQGMAAGTIFTGKFELNISQPLESTKIGIPFVASPKGFSVKYIYQPGEPYKNGYGTVLDKTDSCDMYVLLENKSGDIVKRVATAWIRSGDQIDYLTEISESFTYGSLPSGTPAYQLPADGFANATDEINQITVVFTSSAYGANFEGGVGSTLIATDIKLIY